MDFAGFMKGFRQFFDFQEWSSLPARPAFQFFVLGNPCDALKLKLLLFVPEFLFFHRPL